jgi:hypothetical protein
MSLRIAIAVQPGLEQPKDDRDVAAWYGNPGKGWYDDKGLAKRLMERGHVVSIVSWEDRAIDFIRFDAVFVSSTWNGCLFPLKYVEWLRALEEDGKRRAINGLTVLLDNFQKYRYLPILAEQIDRHGPMQPRGRVVPSRFYIDGPSPFGSIESLGGRTLDHVLADLDRADPWRGSNIVIKPAISADGLDTFVYNRLGTRIPLDADKRSRFEIREPQAARACFARIAADRKRGGAIVQPYIRGVELGEYSLTFFNDRCHCAVRKPGLFKGDGMSRRSFVPPDRLPDSVMGFARFVVTTAMSIYGHGEITRSRVDLFVEDDVPVLCELECVDPNTNIRVLADKVDRTGDEDLLLARVFDAYADAVESRVKALKGPSQCPGGAVTPKG